MAYTPPGWYPGPDGRTRYWDGQSWAPEEQPRRGHRGLIAAVAIMAVVAVGAVAAAVIVWVTGSGDDDAGTTTTVATSPTTTEATTTTTTSATTTSTVPTTSPPTPPEPEPEPFPLVLTGGVGTVAGWDVAIVGGQEIFGEFADVFAVRVVVDIDVTNPGPTPANPFFPLFPALRTDVATYDYFARSSCPPGTTELADVGDVAPGATARFSICWVIDALEVVEAALVADAGADPTEVVEALAG